MCLHGFFLMDFPSRIFLTDVCLADVSSGIFLPDFLDGSLDSRIFLADRLTHGFTSQGGRFYMGAVFLPADIQTRGAGASSIFICGCNLRIWIRTPTLPQAHLYIWMPTGCPGRGLSAGQRSISCLWKGVGSRHSKRGAHLSCRRYDIRDVKTNLDPHL